MRYIFILFIASIVCCSSGHKLFGNTFVKRDVKSDLLTRAAALEKNAAAVATKLRALGITTAATNLEHDASRIAAVAKEFEAATGAAATRLEAEIRAIEMRVTEVIRRDERLIGTTRPRPTGTTPAATTASTSRPPTTSKPSIPPTVVTVESTHKSFEDQMRDSILKRAAALEAKANVEIKILQTSNREALAAGLQLEEMRIQEIATELKKATNAEEMRVLEGELNLLEIRLADELAKIERESTIY